jgi:undecaprenyl-diphosphatase
MDAIDWQQALVLGLVQGLTEFIPVSSTAHLRIVPALLGWHDPGAAFSAVIQLGTLAAVLVYFLRDIVRLSRAALLSLVRPSARALPDARLAWAIAAGNLPIVILGMTLRGLVEAEFRSLFLIAAMLVAVALALAWAERRGEGAGGMEGLTLWRVVAIGCFQALALVPGTSRSGATILGGLVLGLRRAEAARFSFLLGIPAILGSGLFELPHVREGMRAGELSGEALALGLLAAGLSGLGAIAFLLRYLRRHTTAVFILYRLALAVLVLSLAWQGRIR